jgi:hypothetical protein
VSGLLERAAGFLVAPATHVTRAEVRHAARAAVLGAGADAIAVGAGVALQLRRSGDTPAGCVAIWDPAAAEFAPVGMATLAARRLADRLGAHGFEASPRGRLAWVALPAEAGAAAAAWERLAGRIDAPAVLVLGGPRDRAIDAALTEVDVAVLVAPAGADAALVELAAATLPVARVEVARPLALAARLAATSGFGNAGAARAAVRA